MKIRRVVLFVKQSTLEQVRDSKHRAHSDIKRLLRRGHGATAELEEAHQEHLTSLRQVKRELRAREIAFTERSLSDTKPITGVDLVITIGGDGTLLRASHAIRTKTPILGVNSAPAFSVGFLTRCRGPTFARVLEDLIEDRMEPVIVHRLRVRIGNKSVPLPVLNDVLFCHDNPAVTTRYRLQTPTAAEQQRSSGIWIAAPAGTTAALRSAGGQELPLTARSFAFVVREPYAPVGSTVRLRSGVLGHDQKLEIECRVPQASVYLDGSHQRFSVPFGQRASFTLHPRPLHLVR